VSKSLGKKHAVTPKRLSILQTNVSGRSLFNDPGGRCVSGTEKAFLRGLQAKYMRMFLFVYVKSMIRDLLEGAKKSKKSSSTLVSEQEEVIVLDEETLIPEE
jgi:hypothetical protein